MKDAEFRGVLLSSPGATQGESSHPSGPCLSLVEEREPFFGFSKVVGVFLLYFAQRRA